MLLGFIALFGCQLVGEALVHWLQLPVPGAVCGMLLLFLLLFLRALAGAPAVPDSLNQVSAGMIQYLALFFLPAGIGIFFLPAEFSGLWWPLLLVILPGTVLTLVLTAWLLNRLLGNHRLSASRHRD